MRNYIFLIIISLFFFHCYSNVCYSNTKTQTRNINHLKKDIRKSNKEIIKFKQSLEQLKKEQSIKQKEINNLEKITNLLNKNIEVVKYEKHQIQNELNFIRQSITKQKKELSELLKRIYTYGDNSTIKILLNGDQATQHDRFITYYQYIINKKNSLIKEIRQNEEKFANKEKQLKDKEKELNNKYQKLASQQNLLKESYKTQKEVERKLSNSIKEEESQIKEMNNSLAILEKKIQKEKKKIKEKRLAEQTIATTEKDNNNTTIPKTEEIKENYKLYGLKKNNHCWPLKGKILKNYGESRSGNIKWKGILISANDGQDVHAIAKGDVLYSGWLQGFGNIIVIDHGNNYISMYGNNKKLLVDNGQAVQEGQQIANAGNTGFLEINSLYFEIRKNGDPVNPTTYIQRK